MSSIRGRLPIPKPKLDLVLERAIEVPPQKVWAAWTDPKQVVKWFTPAPWKTVECEIDLRPGGKFYTVMQSPEGTDHPNVGCFLEVVENELLVWTDALLPGWRPKEDGFMTAAILIEPYGNGTKYTAIAYHKNEADREKHEKMGFHEGWGTALYQLVAHALGRDAHEA